MIHYAIEPIKPAAHLFQVDCRIENPDGECQLLSLPTWIPGSYLIRDFSRHVVSIHAWDRNGDISLEKIDKQTWQCKGCSGELKVVMEVYAWDLSVRSAHLDTSHGYFNGTSVFLRVHGRESEPCQLDILPPPGNIGKNWRVATSMHRDGAGHWGFGRYRAADYEELIDHPVEMGEFQLCSFEAGGTEHHVVLTGRQDCDKGRLSRDLKRICEHHIEFFGELPEMDQYLFLTMVVGEGYGGLEHRASCSLLCSRDDLPVAGEEKVSDSYRNFLGLCSHEYFHTWNVKRIRPAVFMESDLSSESYTRQLWAFEGITSYYDDLALCRSRLISPEEYLQVLGQSMTRVWRGNGRFRQSVYESSFDAWVKFYKQDENALNAIVSYYTKGALVALALDLTIRQETAGRHSLDDVMRILWQEYGAKNIGVPEFGVEEVASRVAGISLQGFFEHALAGTADLPVNALFKEFGVQFTLRPAMSQKDTGGKPAAVNDTVPQSSLGIRSEIAEGGEKLKVVLDHGAAQEAGLAAGDLVVAVDGIRVGRGGLDKMICHIKPGTTVRIHAFRHDELRVFDVVLKKPLTDTVVLTLLDEVDNFALLRRGAWLGRPDGAARDKTG